MHGGKFFEHLFTTVGDLNKNLPPVRIKRRPRHELVEDQPIDQPRRAMVAKLQSFRQFAHPEPGTFARRGANSARSNKKRAIRPESPVK